MIYKKHNQLQQWLRLFFFFQGITFLFIIETARAQQVDTIHHDLLSPKNTFPENHSPKKAAIMSACLPGLGQIYNKKYWKVPVVYAGFAGLGYSFAFNQNKYSKYRKAYNDVNTVFPFEGKYSKDNVHTLENFYHKNRDRSVIGIAFFYLLNIIDANVDAHLFSFDVSNNLSFNIYPYFQNNTAFSLYPASEIMLTFKL